MTDRKALKDIRAGSQDALVWIIEKYGAYVSTIVRNVIGNAMPFADVEEVSSDVFFALWTQADSVRAATLKGYLAGVARNMAKNKLRRAGHEIALEDNLLLIDGVNLEDVYANKEIQEIVRRAVNAMKEPEREILLRYFYYYQPWM